jgi:hypothetical protein
MPFTPKSGPSAPIVAEVHWSSLLSDFRHLLSLSFAVGLCGECSNAEAEANSANAAHYAAASKTLYSIVACEGSPSSADSLSNLRARVRCRAAALVLRHIGASVSCRFQCCRHLECLNSDGTHARLFQVAHPSP